MDKERRDINKYIVIISVAIILLLIVLVISLTVGGSDGVVINDLIHVPNMIENPNTASGSAIETDEWDVNVDTSKIKKGTALELLQEDIRLLQSDDIDIKHKYFGESTTIDNTNMSDILRNIKISQVKSKKTVDDEQIIHICSVDHAKLKKKRKQIEETAINRNESISEESLKAIVNNALDKFVKEKEYKRCYELKIKKNLEGIILTEKLKEAITGGWYRGIGVKLKPVDCKYK